MKTVAVSLTSLLLGISAFAVPRDRAEMEEAARLQVFLDRANFGPGKIDGRYGEFTTKALELYRIAQGSAAKGVDPNVPPVAEAPEEADAANSRKKEKRKEPAPDVSGIDLASVGEVFTSYTVTEEDTKAVGEVPGEPADQAKLKWLPYRSVAEAVAERFHADIDFLEELNPGKTKDLKPGDTVTVPNVEPFKFERAKDGKGSKGANEEEEAESSAKSKKDGEEKGPERSLRVDTKTNMVEVREGEKLVAAFPVTVGSDETASPIGEWKVKHSTKLPVFRYDKKMLKEGERSDDFHLLPPGPNNPVGVMWIGLNKKGIGLHGTDSPDQIGRNASHGCIRLANWDVVKLATLVEKGTPVTIE